MMQTIQSELQSNRKRESEKENSENTLKGFKMSYAKKMQHSTLKWEDIAGLF